MTRSPVWHPFTQHALEPAMPLKSSGRRAPISTRPTALASSTPFPPGGSSPMATAIPRIMEAIRATASSLDQIIFAGFTHEPAERLARGA